MRELASYVYILASRRNGTLYVGVTNDIARRVWEHKEGVGSAFVSKYGVHRLVWFEQHSSVVEAIAREKRLKRWRRAWKLALIEADNPTWRDLYEDLLY
ncbi:MAG TPA: GIY-YIG nuclease family protein [Caulobacteraceae bacterium]|nr:GIY-YIG nuclease family protein [Caulobacteraceae bacterium]